MPRPRGFAQALHAMDEVDREILALRHFEGLTNNDVAKILGLQKSAASNRYIRALERLRQAMAVIDDGAVRPLRLDYRPATAQVSEP